MLVDVMSLGVTGKEAEHLLDEIGITVNKNQIPFDGQPANTSSGIRVGTPAVTSRGMGTDEMREIGRLIIEAIERRDDAAEQARLADRVARDLRPIPGSGPGRPADPDGAAGGVRLSPFAGQALPYILARLRRGGGSRVRPHAARPADRPARRRRRPSGPPTRQRRPDPARRRRRGRDRLHPRRPRPSASRTATRTSCPSRAPSIRPASSPCCSAGHSRPRSASSTTTSTCGRGGSSPVSSDSRCSRSAWASSSSSSTTRSVRA